MEIQIPGGVTEAFIPGSNPAWDVRGQGAGPYFGVGKPDTWQCLIERKGLPS